MTRTYPPAPPLARADMPTDFAISFDAYSQGGTVRIPEDRGPAQDMPGFDGWRNVVDYIVGITHRIWEVGPEGGPDVAYIGSSYAPESIVFDDFGRQIGNAKIIEDTRHTTGAYPDMVLDAQEVIWAGDGHRGFHTSHRLTLAGTNTGPSRHGAPTGRAIDVLCIANCLVLRNDIYLEHVCYNTAKMLADLGLDPWEEAARMAAGPPAGWPRPQEDWDALRAAARPARPLWEAEPAQGFDPDAFARRVHDSLWNGDMAALADYAEAAPFEGANGRSFEGAEGYRAYLAEFREAFPDLTLQVDEVYWMGNDAEGWRVATRWSAEGTHAGAGHYGAPTGTPVQIWGITQTNVEGGRIAAEWQLFNEFDLMMQIARARQEAA